MTTRPTTTTAPTAHSTTTPPASAMAPPDELLAPLPSTLPRVDRAPVLPTGFAAGAIAAGIKPSGRPDLAVITAIGAPASAAAVFTTNQVVAAPVQASRTNLAITRPEGRGSGADHYGRAQAIVATSGCANAATGLDGLADQVAIAGAVATHFHLDPLGVLSLSTGVIGTRLPVAKVAVGIVNLAAAGLPRTDAGLQAAAEALRTTDTVTKTASVSVALPTPDGSGASVTVSGIA